MKTRVIVKQKPNPKVLEKAIEDALMRLKDRLECELVVYETKK